MRRKKLLALGLAAIMALSTTTMAYAADVTEAASGDAGAGNGDITGYVDKDKLVFSVTTSATVDFKLDPQELMLATKDSGDTLTLDTTDMSAGYGNKILFGGSSGAWTSKSSDFVVVNKGTVDIDVEIGATIDGLTGAAYTIALADSASAVASATTPSIYMELVQTKGAKTTNGVTSTASTTPDQGVAIGANGAKVNGTIATTAAVKAAYKVTESSGVYTYALDSTAATTVDFPTYVYNLQGNVANGESVDWSKYDAAQDNTLKVKVTYNIKKHEEVTYVTTGFQTNVDSSAAYFTHTDFTDATTAADITNIKVNGVAYSGTATVGYKWVTLPGVADASEVTFEFNGSSYKVTIAPAS